MELLSTDAGSRGVAARLAAVLALCALGGCALVSVFRGSTREVVFSHALHVEEEGLSCVSCHEDMAVAEDPGMPALDSCQVCHELWEDEVAPERRVERLYDEAGDFLATGAARLADEVVFEHLRHVRAGLECGACHEGIAGNEAVDAQLAVTMTACEDCHADQGIANDCATCHTEVDRDWAPPSHARAWERAHGDASRVRSPTMAQSCQLCHEESTCADCHEAFPPDDHTNHFRLRGHGILSSLDRARCAACHESSTCERCHAEVLPRSHRGRFGSPRNDHCIGCHLPLRSIECRACHDGTPSHDLGPPKPPWHTPAMDCRQCHMPGRLLMHADNGTNCNLCHP